MTPPPPALTPGTRVLACSVFRPELEAWGLSEPWVEYLDQGLHRYPDDLHARLAEGLARLDDDPEVERVVLFYGQCGGGLEGQVCRRVRLVVAPVADCIPLLLGRSGQEITREGGEAFYLSPGWIVYGKTPLSEYFLTREKFGHEDALWAGGEMLANYRQVVLIDTLGGISDYQLRYAQAMAALYGLEFRQVAADLGWLTRLLAGRGAPGVRVVEPGRPLTADLFRGGGQAAEQP